MISHDQLAQYWIAFGHVSYYRRVDIDQILEGAKPGAGLEEQQQ